jgi:hypothetical protein
MDGITKEVRDLLEKHDWQDSLPRLLLHAKKKAGRLLWRSKFGGSMPGGNEVEDIVMQSIDAIFSGKRAWNPKKHPDLFLYLQGVIDSKINHLAESLENRCMRSASEMVDQQDALNEDECISAFTESPPTPLDNILEKESEEFFLSFYDFLSDDPLLQRCVQAVFDGLSKPAEICKACNVPVEDVYNAKKRLHRRFQDFLEIKPIPVPLDGGE